MPASWMSRKSSLDVWNMNSDRTLQCRTLLVSVVPICSAYNIPRQYFATAVGHTTQLIGNCLLSSCFPEKVCCGALSVNGQVCRRKFYFPSKGILSAVNNCNTYQYLGTQQLFKVDLRNGHYRGGSFRMGHSSCTPEFQTKAYCWPQYSYCLTLMEQNKIWLPDFRKPGS